MKANISQKPLVSKVVRLTGVLLIAGSAFASCDTFNRSSIRQYKETGKEKPSVVSLEAEKRPNAQFPITKTADVRPLSLAQVISIIESVFEVRIPLENLNSNLQLTLSGEFLEPPAELAFDANRWQAIVAFARKTAQIIESSSPRFAELLGICADPSSCSKEAYQRFAPKLLKFPILEESVEAFLEGYVIPDSKNAAALEVVSRMLVSPRLWNLVSVSYPAVPERASIETLIWRKSLFAWREAPSSEALKDSEEKNSEVWTRSLFDDARYAQTFGTFIERWLGLDLLKSQTKNTDAYPGQLSASPSDFSQEILLNAKRVFEENRDIRSLLFSEDWLVPEDLKKHYELQEMNEKQIRRVGYLTSGAFAALTSGPFNTKPTSRGHFVMKKFLCQEIAAPPAGAGRIPDELAGQAISAREKAMIHAKVEPCASCHRLMDPIGFLLEPLDPVGRFRSTYQILNAAGFNFGNASIDTRVQLEFGAVSGEFSDIALFSQELAKQRAVTRCVVKKFLQFALGVDEKSVSVAEVESAARQFYAAPLTPKALGYTITKLPSFRAMEVPSEIQKMQNFEPNQ